MPADATPTAPVTDSVTAIDLVMIRINAVDSLIEYALRTTWSSGQTTERRSTVKASDFVAAIASFCQATPRKKFLTWLAANGYESNLTIA